MSNKGIQNICPQLIIDVLFIPSYLFPYFILSVKSGPAQIFCKEFLMQWKKPCVPQFMSLTWTVTVTLETQHDAEILLCGY